METHSSAGFSEPVLMGILNVTPDSFSDGGRYLECDAAVNHARKLVAEGASIIDVGGESSRPGAEAVTPALQISRVVPVIEAVRTEFGSDVRISIDARSAVVARAGVAAGADMLNDISAGDDPEMLALAAEHGLPIVLMHMQGTPETMQNEPAYADVVAEVCEYLLRRAELAAAAGVASSNIIVDPGIGFGKNRVHNLALVAGLPDIVALGFPVLLGTSRKRFMGAICQETVFHELVGATCATTVVGYQAGVKIFRVHDVRENRQALEVAAAIERASA